MAVGQLTEGEARASLGRRPYKGGSGGNPPPTNLPPESRPKAERRREIGRTSGGVGGGFPPHICGTKMLSVTVKCRKKQPSSGTLIGRWLTRVMIWEDFGNIKMSEKS